MTQSLAQNFSQQMRMEQRLTPQLIQSMAILQKPVAELEAYVNEALESNAALEIAEPQARDASESNGLSPSSEPRRALLDDDRFARMAQFNRANDLDFDDRPPSFQRVQSSGEPDPKMAAMANSPGREDGLYEHLLNQWNMTDVEEPVRRAGQVIIQNLELDGYLRTPLEVLSAEAHPPLSIDVLKAALDRVQRLDPPGVGARDLNECLLLQIQALPGDNSIEQTLVRNHLDDIVHNRLPAVARATGYSLGEIQEALKAMRATLHLHPGLLVGDRGVPPIRPDAIVDYAETGDGLTVRLARGNLPPLRINDEMADLSKSRENGKEARDFARKQIDAAASIIDAVQFRQSRILEVTKAIVEKQREFFDVGPEGLKVLRMSDLAQELGCDPSTISRTVADKHLQTPKGIYPMRYFFSGGTETEDGETIGWDRVKTRVREIVDAEDKKNPLNDDQIAELLKKEGIVISRRTVAKYRTQLGIPTLRQRRQFES